MTRFFSLRYALVAAWIRASVRLVNLPAPTRPCSRSASQSIYKLKHVDQQKPRP